MNAPRFDPPDVAQLDRFAHALRRRFTSAFDATNAPADIEMLIDLWDRLRDELETGHPASITQSDAATLATVRRNLGRGQLRDLDQLTPEARRDVEYRRGVSDALARIESVVQTRLSARSLSAIR